MLLSRYRNIELGFTLFNPGTGAGATRVAIGTSNFASGAVLLSTQWAFIVSLACVCTQASHVRIVGNADTGSYRILTRVCMCTKLCVHAQSITSCDVSKLSAKELVDTFRAIKSKHDDHFRVAHGAMFLSALVLYYFCETSQLHHCMHIPALMC